MTTDPFAIVGTTLAEKYAILEAVAEGGGSVVYRAMHRVWQRPVAIKALRLNVPSEDEHDALLASFVREGALLAELSEKSAAICQARDVGTFVTPTGQWVPYLVLEWLEGKSLEAELALERAQGAPRRSLARAVELMTPVVLALAAAHRVGIAHRDVKPSNLFLVERDDDVRTLKLLDFGIANVVTDTGRRGRTVFGYTPAYAAPEQFEPARFGATGPRTDVFAIALVMTELLSAKAPMLGDTIDHLASQATNMLRRPTPRARGAIVPDEVEAVFERALAVEPGDRYADAGELWTALLLALEAPPVDRAAELVQTIETIDESFVYPAGMRRRGGAGWRVIGAGLAAGALSAAILYTHDPRSFVASVDRAHRVASAALVASFPLERAGVAAPSLGHDAIASELDSDSADTTFPLSGDQRACPVGMSLVTGGKFFMGSDDDLPIERPAHAVTLSGFCIDTTEVTTRDYRACSDRGECKRAGTTNAGRGLDAAQRRVLDPFCNAREPDSRALHPVNCVDWEMADTFCRARGTRLPTEAEWELAARGPDGRKYPWGDLAPTAEHANVCGLECTAWGAVTRTDLRAMHRASDGWPTSAPVGSFPRGRSPAGAEDMIGNVAEWVADRFVAYGEPSFDTDRELRVVRGGGWASSAPQSARATFRQGEEPSRRSAEIGFRCATTL